MTCKLCRQQIELIRQSHIIPKFMYKGILEKNQKMVEINLFKTDTAKLRPTPAYDQYILCKQCDNVVLSRLETYAAKILYERTDLKFETQKEVGLTSLIIKDIDYQKFKLFLLSILWRSSISTNPLFKDINLGQRYENTIREMILEGNPGNPEDFPVCIFGIKSNENLMLKTVIKPRRLKDNGNTSYMFFINGLFYYFNISKYRMQDMFTRLPIDRNNEMTIGIIEDKIGEDFFDKFMGKRIRLSKKNM